MKPYDYLNDFLKDPDRMNKFIKPTNDLVMESKEINDSIFSKQRQFEAKNDEIEKLIYSERNKISKYNKVMDINSSLGYAPYDKYYLVFANFDDRKEFDRLITGTESITLNNYLSVIDTMTIDDSGILDCMNFNILSQENICLFETNLVKLHEYMIEVLDETCKINPTENENTYNFIANVGNTKFLVSGVYDKNSKDGHFLFQIISKTHQIIENVIIYTNDVAFVPNGNFIYSKKEYNVKRFLENQSKQRNVFRKEDKVLTKRSIYYIRLLNLFYRIMKLTLSNKFEYKENVATNLELHWIKRIISETKEFDKKYIMTKFPLLVRKVDINEVDEIHDDHVYTSEDLVDLLKDEKDKDKINSDYMNIDFINSKIDQFNENKSDYLELDLNPKDAEKICNYHKRNYINKDKHIDLVEVFNKQRFGINFKMVMEDYYGNDIYIRPEINTEKNILNFHIYFNYNHYDFMVVFSFKNIQNFMIFDQDCFNRASLFIRFDSQAEFMASRLDLLHFLPAPFDQSSKVFALVNFFISTYIMIADKPEKLCSARQERVKTYKEKQGKKYIEKSDVIIKHIIAYRSTVLNKIKESKNSGLKREVEYVMENWDRVGHTRTYKNGKTIWIEPTSCTRHLELTKKQVKIKL